MPFFFLLEAFKTQTAEDGAQLIKVTSICRVKARRPKQEQKHSDQAPAFPPARRPPTPGQSLKMKTRSLGSND